MMTRATIITEPLEVMINKHGLIHILTGLEFVCIDKAARLRTTRQGEKAAQQYEKAASAIYAAADKIANDIGLVESLVPKNPETKGT